MELSLAFAVTLLFAVMISGFAHRSILSTAVLFLGVGLVLGLEPVGVLSIRAGDPFVDLLVQVALFSVLFTRRHECRGQGLDPRLAAAGPGLGVRACLW